MLHISCDGCRYKRKNGRCAGRALCTDPQVTDDSPRLCYDLPRTLSESLALYTLENERKNQARGKV